MQQEWKLANVYDSTRDTLPFRLSYSQGQEREIGPVVGQKWK